MIVFGGGHNDYFGSDVHAFDLAQPRVATPEGPAFVTGDPDDYGEGAIYPDAVYPDNSPLPPHTYDYIQYDEVEQRFHIVEGPDRTRPERQSRANSTLVQLWIL